MKMKYIDAVNRHSNLMKLGKKVLPRKINVAIARNLVKLEDEMKALQSQPEDIASRYACKDADGEFIKNGDQYTFATPEDKEAYYKEFKDFMESEIDINASTFEEVELDKCEEEGSKFDMLTSLELAYLEWMIKD